MPTSGVIPAAGQSIFAKRSVRAVRLLVEGGRSPLRLRISNTVPATLKLQDRYALAAEKGDPMGASSANRASCTTNPRWYRVRTATPVLLSFLGRSSNEVTVDVQ